MQSFSPSQNLVEVWQGLHASVGAGRLVAFGAASFAAGIVAAWVASLPVAGESATIGRALKIWLAWLGVTVVLAIAVAVGLPFAIRDEGGVGLVVVGLVLFCLVVIAIVGVPMAVYGIGVLRSLGFNAIYMVVGGVMHIVLRITLLGSTPAFNPQVFRQLLATPQPGVAEVESLRGRLRERQAGLARRHEALEIRRRHLPPGDSQARGDYERERDAYERELAELRTEAAALPPR